MYFVKSTGVSVIDNSCAFFQIHGAKVFRVSLDIDDLLTCRETFRLVYHGITTFRIFRRMSRKVERIRKQCGTKCFKAPTHGFTNSLKRPPCHSFDAPCSKEGSFLLQIDVEHALLHERVSTSKRRVIFVPPMLWRVHATNWCSLWVNRNLDPFAQQFYLTGTVESRLLFPIVFIT